MWFLCMVCLITIMNFVLLKLLVVWKVWLSLTADLTIYRRHRRQNVTIWLNAQWLKDASV